MAWQDEIEQYTQHAAYDPQALSTVQGAVQWFQGTFDYFKAALESTEVQFSDKMAIVRDYYDFLHVAGDHYSKFALELTDDYNTNLNIDPFYALLYKNYAASFAGAVLGVTQPVGEWWGNINAKVVLADIQIRLGQLDSVGDIILTGDQAAETFRRGFDNFQFSNGTYLTSQAWFGDLFESYIHTGSWLPASASEADSGTVTKIPSFDPIDTYVNTPLSALMEAVFEPESQAYQQFNEFINLR